MACNANDKNQKQFENDSSDKKLVKNIKIPLYTIDTVFEKYMPDTGLKFNSPDELKKYWLKNYKNFKDFCNRYSDERGNDDLSILAVRQAEIHFADLDEFNYFKFYKTWKKDLQNMVSLSSFSPNSNIVSLEERINFFKAFPHEIQNSKTGKNTWARIREYSFDKNTGHSAHQYDSVKLIAYSNNKTFFKNIFHTSYNYYIILFGASWCGPCNEQELQLKYWINYLDTSRIKIIGLSVDDKINDWKKNLEKYNFPWSCYMLEGAMNNQMVKSLGIGSVPRVFLLDNSGKILFENTDIRKILLHLSL